MIGILRAVGGIALAMCMFSVSGLEARELRIAIVSRTVFYVPLWIANRQGFFKDEGIDPVIEIYNNAEKINEDMKSGRVQISVSTPESVVMDAYRGGSLRLVAGNAEKLPHFIITKPEIKSLADLRGAKFGVLSLQEGTTYLVRQLTKIAGLGPDEYQILAVGGAPARWKLLREGKIDVGLQPFPLSYEAEQAGFSNLGPIAKYVPDYQFTTINVDINWARENRDIVTRFLRAMQRGQKYLGDNPQIGIEIAARELNTSIELARRALQDTADLKILSSDLSLSKPGVAYVFETLKAADLVPADAKFDLGRISDDSFLNESRR